ncbi:MAG: type II toxin-antitoxin system VapC family toxin [Myxococcales bacterium]|nr:type II toxin-antitoxin system VapC family toxin [Myxococcales bacterium]
MTVLDTNVLSELMRESASKPVLEWLSAQTPASLFTTTITEAEVFLGLALLPSGKRRRALEGAAAGLFADFEGRVLAFDSPAAKAFAEIGAARRRAGRPISHADAQIAAIVRSRGARLATRDGNDFGGCGIEVVDPWSSG